MKPLPWLNMNAKPIGVEEKAAQTGINDTFHQNVNGFARTAKARFEHREAHLHPEYQECRDQCPGGVTGLMMSAAFTSVSAAYTFAKTRNRQQAYHKQHGSDAQSFAQEQRSSILAPLRILQPRGQP